MRSLRGRLILSHILPVLIILPVMGFGLFALLRTQILLSNLSKELVDQAQLVASTAGDYAEIWYDPGRAEAWVAAISPKLMAQITLMDAYGQVIVSTDPAMQDKIGQEAILPAVQEQLFRSNIQVSYSSHQANEITKVILPVYSPGRRLHLGYVQLSNPFTGIDAEFQRLRQLLLGVLGGGLVAGVIFGSILAVQLERPLKGTTRAVNQLANGEKLEPLQETGPEEIRTLVRAFNALVLRLQNLETSRSRLLANLVHEIGRPLGAMQSGVDALLRGADEDIHLRKELLAGIRDELSRLRSLLNELATLHDQVLGKLELNRTPVEIEPWLSRVLLSWREAALEKNQAWQVEIQPGLPRIMIDQDRFSQAVGNLLSNAVQYTPRGGLIEIAAGCRDEKIFLSISDSGPGISPDEKEQIFTPFYRGRAARRFSNGMGLGLSIAKEVVEAHHGQITAENRAQGGCRFTIQLPVEIPDS